MALCVPQTLATAAINGQWRLIYRSGVIADEAAQDLSWSGAGGYYPFNVLQSYELPTAAGGEGRIRNALAQGPAVLFFDGPCAWGAGEAELEFTYTKVGAGVGAEYTYSRDTDAAWRGGEGAAGQAKVCVVHRVARAGASGPSGVKLVPPALDPTKTHLLWLRPGSFLRKFFAEVCENLQHKLSNAPFADSPLPCSAIDYPFIALCPSLSIGSHSSRSARLWDEVDVRNLRRGASHLRYHNCAHTHTHKHTCALRAKQVWVQFQESAGARVLVLGSCVHRVQPPLLHLPCGPQRRVGGGGGSAEAPGGACAVLSSQPKYPMNKFIYVDDKCLSVRSRTRGVAVYSRVSSTPVQALPGDYEAVP